mgnify:FL=1
MRNIILCGHTGSVNRGCEAIVRSTAKILKLSGYEKNTTVLTFNKNCDEFLNVNDVVDLVAYPKKNIFERALGKINRDFFKNPLWSANCTYKKAFGVVNTDDSIIFNIGGDTYCYGIPYLSIALNMYCEKNNIPSVFWGCSVEDNVLTEKIIKEDLERYDYIIARESLSYDILKQCKKENVYLACDPAFQLPIKETELPKPWKNGNTLGINISPIVMSEAADENITYQNICYLIEKVLNDTDMNICLIPHVYNIEKNLEDIRMLKPVYEKYKSTGRISIVDKELSCTQLKYIISKCRFFIGARTHSTIAAYSTGVPSLVLGYSIKSRGIAKDLFGNEKRYAISWKDLKYKEQLWKMFDENVIQKEEELHNRYNKILPDYKNSIIEVSKKMLGEIK